MKFTVLSVFYLNVLHNKKLVTVNISGFFLPALKLELKKGAAQCLESEELMIKATISAD